MAVEEGGFIPGPESPTVVRQPIDALDERLLCITEAAEKGFKPEDQWADWLKEGVKIKKEGGDVTREWLEEFDRTNSYI